MGHLLTMKNECTICQAVIEMEEQFQFSLPLLFWLSVPQSINSFLPYYSQHESTAHQVYTWILIVNISCYDSIICWFICKHIAYQLPTYIHVNGIVYIHIQEYKFTSKLTNKPNKDKNKITADSSHVILNSKCFKILLQFASPRSKGTCCKSIAQELF